MCLLLSALILLAYTNLISVTATPYIVKDNYRRVVPASFRTLFGEHMCTNKRPDMTVEFSNYFPVSSFDKINPSGVAVAAGALKLMPVSDAGSDIVGIKSKSNFSQSVFAESYLYTTASFETSDAINVDQLVGLLGDESGITLGTRDSTFGILYRNNSVDTFIPSTSFNIDPLDGSGVSKMNLIPSYINTYRISFGWLGNSPIIFEILTPEGTWHPFHILRYTNYASSPSLINANLPVVAKVNRNSGNARPAMRIYGLEFGKLVNSGSVATPKKTFTTIASDVEIGRDRHIITIKNNSNEGKSAQLTAASFSSAKGNIRLEIVKNATLTSTNFMAVDNGSFMQKSLAANTDGGSVIWQVFTTGGDTSKEFYFKSKGINLTLEVGDTISIVACDDLPRNPKIDAILAWEE